MELMDGAAVDAAELHAIGELCLSSGPVSGAKQQEKATRRGVRTPRVGMTSRSWTTWSPTAESHRGATRPV